MGRFYLIGFLVLVVFDTAAQIGFKFSGMNIDAPSISLSWVLQVITQKWTYLAVLGYLGAFGTWMTLLKHAPIGPAFAASHLEVVTVCLFSAIWLGERFSLVQLLGSILIVGGIIVLAIAEQEIEHVA
jgi:drug/metabolite transporter (DMT)-like permease